MSERSPSEWMSLAIEESCKGFPAPNPHVGCVIVKDGRLIGKGHHEFAGGPHAEVNALTDCNDSPEGAVAYVTLEPCNHRGRTGPCSQALIASRIAKVVFAVQDPNPEAGGGAETLKQAGVQVESGLLAEEAERANEVWLTAVRRESPYVIAKAGISLDGCVSLQDGRSQWITTAESRLVAHQLRAEMGSVLVGSKTVEIDNPSLTVRGFEVKNQPVRVVLDSKRRLSETFNVFDGSAPTIRVVSVDPKEGELQVSLVDDELDLRQALMALYKAGVRGVLVEGGRRTLSRFIEQNLVDRIELFISPKLLGSSVNWFESDRISESQDPLISPPRWKFDSVRQISDDVQVTLRPNP